jgi:hypothetical protein
LQRVTLIAFLLISGPAFFFPSLHVGDMDAAGLKLTRFRQIHLSLRMARNMFAGSWMTFIDQVLSDLGAPAAYRAKASADMEAMIELGFFEHIHLGWFIGLPPGEQEPLP